MAVLVLVAIVAAAVIFLLLLLLLQLLLIIIDIKPSNFRVGMLGWAGLPIIFTIVDMQKNPAVGWTVSGAAINTILVNM